MTRVMNTSSRRSDISESGARSTILSVIDRAHQRGAGVLQVDLHTRLVDLFGSDVLPAERKERLSQRDVAGIAHFFENHSGRLLQFSDDQIAAVSSVGRSAYRIDILLWRTIVEAAEEVRMAPAYVAGNDPVLTAVIERRIRSLGVVSTMLKNHETVAQRFADGAAVRPVLYIAIAEISDAEPWFDAVKTISSKSYWALVVLLKHTEAPSVVRWIECGASLVLPWHISGAVFEAYVRRLHREQGTR